MNSSKLRFENIWVFLIWVVIFMSILTWDQEKIVVVNLILFSYFIYYLLSDTIYLTLNARKQFLLSTLLGDINARSLTLKLSLEQVLLLLKEYNNLLLILIKKTLMYVIKLALKNSTISTAMLPSYFEELGLYLSLVNESITLQNTQMNLFVAASLSAEVEPSSISDLEIN